MAVYQVNDTTPSPLTDKEASAIIWNPESQLPPRRPMSGPAAIAAAQDMAERHPGQVFYVCHLVSACYVPPSPTRTPPPRAEPRLDASALSTLRASWNALARSLVAPMALRALMRARRRLPAYGPLDGFDDQITLAGGTDQVGESISWARRLGLSPHAVEIAVDYHLGRQAVARNPAAARSLAIAVAIFLQSIGA